MKKNCGLRSAKCELGRSARSRRSLIRNPRSAFRNIVIFAALITVVWLLLPKPPLLDGVSFSQSVRDRNGELLRVTLTSDQKFRIWAPLREIAPELVNATLQYEDKYFSRHPGVNPFALVRSGFGLVRGGPRTGASTITMQVARLRFHLQTRTPLGKVRQIVRALELERHYSKSEILEAYLNLAPYGRNIEGIGAASQIYFGKAPVHLTRPESISLSVIPQSPTRRALHADRDNRSLNAAQGNWYDRAVAQTSGLWGHGEDARDTESAAREFSARAGTDRIFFAPHFVQQVLNGGNVNDTIATTLDLEKQQLVERRIADYIRANRNRGFQNAAAMLVDTRNMDVVAQVGSADFFNAKIDGQVDGTRSPRSPGSTLKPFVYALAMDQGLIHPLSILADAPRSFGDYNPENFDRDFLGPIRACDALARSRNLPAVELASHLTHSTLYQFLSTAEVRLPKTESFYGLALPLGGAEVSLQDLVRLYAALANDGELRPLRFTERDRVANSKRI